MESPVVNAAEEDSYQRTVDRAILINRDGDQSAMWVGGTARKIAAAIEERPILKYGLIGLDVAAGPALFAIRRGISASPVGEWVERKQEKVLGAVSDKYQADPGYGSDDSMDAALGIFVGISLALGGAVATAKKLGAIGRRLAELPPGPTMGSRRAQMGAVGDLSMVRPVNGRSPINSSKYAGRTIPLTDLPRTLRNRYPHSVPFTPSRLLKYPSNFASRFPEEAAIGFA